MSADAAQKLRETLKLALQDARKLYDGGLIDENEFKALKDLELTKYKQELTAIPDTSAAAISSSPVTKTTRLAPLTPVRTPLTTRLNHSVRQSPASAPSYLSPPTQIKPRFSKEEVLVVDSGTFQRLTTPPIFRRRRSRKRRIIVPSEELNKLRQAPQLDQNNKSPTSGSSSYPLGGGAPLP
ncbi:unnamed protein product [Agarophyton chilense]